MLGRFFLHAGPDPAGQLPKILFTENESNTSRLWNSGDKRAFVKDAFHEYVVGGRTDAVNPAGVGTKAALHYVLRLPAGAAHTVSLRLFAEKENPRGSTWIFVRANLCHPDRGSRRFLSHDHNRGTQRSGARRYSASRSGPSLEQAVLSLRRR